MEEFKVIIAGCRDYNDYDFAKEKILYYLQYKMKTHNVIIVSGHASGADAIGERFAQEYNLKAELHPADWERYGKSAGPRRNREMAECSHALIAFWDGNSRGTKTMIDFATEKGLKTKVIRIDK